MDICRRIILNFVHAPDNSIGKVLNTISYHMELHRLGIALSWALPTLALLVIGILQMVSKG